MRRHVFYMIGLACLILIIVLQCESSKKQISNLRARHDHEKGDFKKSINELGLEVNTQKLILISNKKQLRKTVDKVNGLRKINGQFKATVEVEITNVIAEPVTPPKVILDSTKNAYTLKLPQAYGKETKHYSIYYHIDTLGQSKIDGVLFNLDIKYTVGYKDKGKIGNLFKRQEPIVAFELGSPHASVVNMSNISYEKPKQNIITKALVLAGVFFVGRSTK